MTTNNSHNGISALFASATLGELLYLFMLEPEREYYQRELQRLSGAHLRQLQRDLERLQRSGLVVCRTHGNRTYYRPVPAHPAFADLRAAVMKTMGLGVELSAALAGLGGAVTLAFVYGSFARGDDVAESDVDVLIVGSATRRDVAAALADAARSSGRELNPIIVSPADFTRRWREGDHFVTSILAGPRIWLIGDDASLAARLADLLFGERERQGDLAEVAQGVRSTVRGHAPSQRLATGTAQRRSPNDTQASPS